MLAVITGASSGIGSEFARKLAARGYNLLLAARREDRLRSLAEELRNLYRIQAEAFVVDLTDDAGRERLAARLRNSLDLHLLVNNAGFGIMGYFFETDPAMQLKMNQLHILATMSLTHSALANLVPRGLSNTGVINVSSVAAFSASPTSVTYSASKAWMNAFTEGLATELGARNSPVRVQALCPGFTLTEFHDVARVERSLIPSSLWLTADYVVTESLRGFDRGDVVVVPNWRYQALTAFMKFTPGPLMRWVSVAAARRYRRRKA
jgi:hypothetical protein